MDSTICLFDVDGTLTKPRNVIDNEMFNLLERLQKKVKIGVVGGSDFSKILEQLGGMNNLKKIEYVFSENGLLFHRFGELVCQTSIIEVLGEETLQNFINYSLKYLSNIRLPIKRGTFVEYRTGMVNISPIGRNCSQSERDEFERYDKIHQVRNKMIADLRQNFGDLGLTFAIGGQISFDVFPNGWDKRYSLQFVKNDFKTIHYFGDKTFEGGNDYGIFHDELVTGHTVTGPDDTRRQLSILFDI